MDPGVPIKAPMVMEKIVMVGIMVYLASGMVLVNTVPIIPKKSRGTR